MNFNSQTKISEIINHNKSAIDAIAAIAPPLKRLKNPILRKVMASRVTVAEAAKMGGCKVEDFVRVLVPLGYHYEDITAQAAAPVSARPAKPDWLLLAPEKDVLQFDVRAIIEQGTDPLKAIMAKFKEVPAGKILCIINTFVPTPLIHLLGKDKTDASFVDPISSNEFHTYFLKKKNEQVEESASEEKVVMHDAASFEKICNRFSQDQKKEIDVRALEMPLPMQTILGDLEQLADGHALFVNHKRVPVFLLEELADKDFSVHIYNVDEGNVKMLLFKKS